MVRRLPDGRFIFSAGEVGSFVVCPESWRLRTVEDVERTSSDSVDIGKELHAQWVDRYDEAFSLVRSLKLMLAAALLTFLFTLSI